MARNGSGVYSKPVGTTAVSGQTIESAKYNAFVDDITADQNTPRPVVAGGTGVSSIGAFQTAMGVVVGTNVQAYSARLTYLSGTPDETGHDGDFLIGDDATSALKWQTPAEVLALIGADDAANLTSGTLNVARAPTSADADLAVDPTLLPTRGQVGAAIVAIDFGAEAVALAAGSIGTYVLASWPSSGSAKTIGDTVAGSTLRLASYSHVSNNSGAFGSVTTTALSGTWRLMGGWAGTANNSVSLFQRVS